MRWVGTLFLVIVLLVPAARADRIHQAFTTGRFLEAAELAQEAGGADNLAVAARSLLADAVINGEPMHERLNRAESMARAALQLDPDHVEGRLQLAIAVSLKARLMSTGAAMNSGYGGLSRDLAESVIEDDPENFYAHGFMAVWNIEIVRRGGSFGSAFMGASVRKGRRHYYEALETGTVDPSLHWQYARALAALNARKYSDEIEAALQRACVEQADDALSQLMQARARSFQSYLDSHSVREVEQAAAMLL